MEVSSFTEKLNKVDGNTYVIEEEVRPVDGVYEALLAMITSILLLCPYNSTQN